MTGPQGERWEVLGPLGTAALVAFPNTRDEEGGAGSFRSAAAGTAAAHRTSTPPDWGDRPPPPAPRPRGLDAGGASPQNKEPGRGCCGRGLRGAVRPPTRGRGPAGVPGSVGRRFPSAPLGAQRPPRGPLSLSRAVTSFRLERPPARLEQSARGLGQRGRRLDNRTRTLSPRPVRAARTPADGTDTSRPRCPLTGAGARVCGSATRGRASRCRSPESQTKAQLVRPPSHMCPAASAGSEAGPSLRARRPPSLGQFLLLLVACRLAQRKAQQLSRRVPGADAGARSRGNAGS